MKSRIINRRSSQNIHTTYNFYKNPSHHFLMLARLDPIPSIRKVNKKRNKYTELVYQDDRTFFNVNMKKIRKDLNIMQEKSKVLPIIINIPKKIFRKDNNQENQLLKDLNIEQRNFFLKNKNIYHSLQSNEKLEIPLNTRKRLKKRFKNFNLKKKIVQNKKTSVKNSIDCFNISGNKVIQHCRNNIKKNSTKNVTSIFQTNIDINDIPKKKYLYKRNHNYFFVNSSLTNLRRFPDPFHNFRNMKITTKLSKLSPIKLPFYKNISQKRTFKLIPMDQANTNFEKKRCYYSNV